MIHTLIYRYISDTIDWYTIVTQNIAKLVHTMHNMDILSINPQQKSTITSSNENGTGNEKSDQSTKPMSQNDNHQQI